MPDPELIERLPELVVLGHIRTPWARAQDCPRNAMESDATARVEVLPPWRPGLASLEGCTHVILLYWLHQADRSRLVQTPASDDKPHGVFALRTPNRPNPIGLAVADLVAVRDTYLKVRHIDCVDGTPLLDIKPYFASVDAKPEARVEWWEARACPQPPRGQVTEN